MRADLIVRDTRSCGVSSTLVFGVDLTQPDGLRFFRWCVHAERTKKTPLEVFQRRT
jgi:hypothetical protein